MRHIHRYTRIDLSRDKNKPRVWVMRCNLPRCNSYTFMKTKMSCPALKGKEALCNRCGEEFLLNKRALQMANPCCDGCVLKKDDNKKSALDKLFDNITREVNDTP